MSINTTFTKANLDRYLSLLAKEYRKRSGTQIRAEIILIGGAAVLTNYGFRDMTYDIDAIIKMPAQPSWHFHFNIIFISTILLLRPTKYLWQIQ